MGLGKRLFVGSASDPVADISDLKAHYKFDNDVTDSSGNGHNATNTNMLFDDTVKEYGTHSIKRDATGQDSVDFPFSLTKDQTLIFWFRQGAQTTADSGGNYRYYAYDMHTATYSYVHIYFAETSSGMELRINWRQDGSNYYFTNTDIDSSFLDGFNMIAVYFTGTEGVYYSVNGSNWATATATINVGTNSTLPSGNFALGNLFSNGSNLANPNPYRVDQMRVYNKILSNSELTTLYNE